MTHIRTSRALVPPKAGADNRFGWAGLLAGICGLTLFWLPYFFPAAGLSPADPYDKEQKSCR